MSVKLKTTTKQMRQYHRIVRIGYCEAQALLKYASPFAYSSGVYGWNGDYYEVDGVLIATGYRSLPDSKNVRCDYSLVREYENKAGKLTSREDVENLLHEFITKITEEGKGAMSPRGVRPGTEAANVYAEGRY